MWEILYGKTISYNQKLDMSKLCFLIYYSDLRPAVNKEAPQCYVNLMRKCWDKIQRNVHLQKIFVKILRNGRMMNAFY
ncbi:hypothetical protein C2G38_1995688 [Gigaspora rosea]|uniref:Serine-threonine/tyrosine-protein kinase catalytic domain-containing protein n=1 Tax=Gigaspora rosea TaxID=44941 RepID=A0A397W5G4_9GLOM|nr:hypothetical protein C2G38_1995688 [Gigaspora rosea]